MDSEREHEDKIVVGTIVRHFDGEDDEYGVVISTWRNPEIDMMKDCLVAFWGKEIPDFESEVMVEPTIFRYAAVSLHPVGEGQPNGRQT